MPVEKHSEASKMRRLFALLNGGSLFLSLTEQGAQVVSVVKNGAFYEYKGYGKEKNRNTFNESRNLYAMEC